jgi:hypothetical protein
MTVGEARVWCAAVVAECRFERVHGVLTSEPEADGGSIGAGERENKDEGGGVKEEKGTEDRNPSPQSFATAA